MKALRRLGRLAIVSDRDDLLQMIKDMAVVHGDFVFRPASGELVHRPARILLSGRAAPLAGG